MYPLKKAVMCEHSARRDGTYRQLPNGRWGYLIEERILKEHIDDYDRMDSRLRAEQYRDRGRSVELFYHALTAVYHEQGKDSDKTISIVMNRLLGLIEEKQKLNNPDFRGC